MTVKVDDPGLMQERGMTLMGSSTSPARPIVSQHRYLPPHPNPLPQNGAREISCGRLADG
jgi:hypothetical protein